MQKNIEWSTEMKISLIIIDGEEWQKGRGFMKWVKERWDAKHPEHPKASMQKPTDNASQFKKDHEIMNLMIMRKGTKINCQWISIWNRTAREPNKWDRTSSFKRECWERWRSRATKAN